MTQNVCNNYGRLYVMGFVGCAAASVFTVVFQLMHQKRSQFFLMKVNSAAFSVGSKIL